MTDQEMDLILRERGDYILPASGFLESVMIEVQSEASTLPPIPFPWKRALPGLISAVVVLLVLLTAAASIWLSPQFQSTQSVPLLLFYRRFSEVISRIAMLWTSVAVFLVFLCLAGSRRLASIR